MDFAQFYHRNEAAAATVSSWKWGVSFQPYQDTSHYEIPRLLHIWADTLKPDQMRSVTPALPRVNKQISHLWGHQAAGACSNCGSGQRPVDLFTAGAQVSTTYIIFEQ